MAKLPNDVAVLLIGHGSVESEADIAAFVDNVRNGGPPGAHGRPRRPVPQAIVDEVTHRWRAIGGSPLLEITRAQADALRARLGAPVVVGMRLWHPYAHEALAGLTETRRVISLPLAPYSVHVYNPVSAAACERLGLQCLPAAAWNEEPALIEAFADTIRAVAKPGATLLFTAHSLPSRVIAMGDPYERQVRATASAVASRVADVLPSHVVAFQSQGMDGGDWLGPDLVTTFDRLASEGVHDVVVCAIGFLADHTEILYDLDVEARDLAKARGITLTRAASLGTHPRLIDALEHVALATISAA